VQRIYTPGRRAYTSDNENLHGIAPAVSQRGVTLLVQVKTAKTSVLSMDYMYAGHATKIQWYITTNIKISG
jgi:hypothetical protein